VRRLRVRQQLLALDGPPDGPAHVGPERRWQPLLVAVGRRYQGERAKPLQHQLAAHLLRHAEHIGAQHVQPIGKAWRLGIDEPCRQGLGALRRSLREPREPQVDLIHHPAIEIVETGEHRGLTLLLQALALGLSARRGLRIGGLRGIGLLQRRDHRCAGFRASIDAAGSMRGIRRAARLGPAAGHPVLHPIRSRARLEPLRLVATHPHDGQHVLAGKLAARAGALVAHVAGRHDHPVRCRARALAFPPQQRGIGRARQHRPSRRLHKLQRRAERRLVRRQLFDPFLRQCFGHGIDSR
jgi:hypothetical protein